MSQDFQVDGKPLASLRVVDLREELKKRGIRASGTKVQLQELLTAALESEKDHEARQIETQQESNNDKEEAPNDDHSNHSNTTREDSPSESKIASLSFNEEKETIKLTIRSSPRKAEESSRRESPSDSEDSQTDSSDSENSSSSQSQTINKSSYKSEELSQDSVKTEGSYNPSSIENGDSPTGIQVKEEVKSNLTSDDKLPHFECKTKENVSELPETCSKIEEEPDYKNDKSDDRTDHFKDPSPLENGQAKTNDNFKVKLDTEPSETSQSVSDVKSRSSRRILIQSKSIEEKDASKPMQKKRRWGGSQSSTPSSSLLAKGISSDKLKQLINDSVEAETAKVSKLEEEVVLSVDKDDQPIELNYVEEVKNFEVVTASSKIEATFKSTENIVKQTVKEDEKEPVRTVSPAKNPQSVVLFITGLVRPYTLVQLKKLLAATGTIDEEKFWIDKIKSKCYVTYESVEEAVATRQALHNLKWPQSSPKNLCVEFATLEDIDRCLHPENYEDLPTKSPAKMERKQVAEKPELNRGKYDLIRNESKEFERKKEESNQQPRVREWDREKLTRPVRNELKEIEARKKPRNSPPLREPTRERRDKQDRRSKSLDHSRRDETNHRRESRSESPAKLLEDLFRKTKATPYIYWLPLTDEQASERQKQRAMIEKERDARIANRREALSPRKRQASPLRPFGRDRPPPAKFQRRSPLPPPARRRPSYSRSPSPRRRYSRSRSPDRRRFSPRRRR